MLDEIAWVIEGLRVDPGADAREPRGRRRARFQPVGAAGARRRRDRRATTRTASCSGPPPPRGTRTSGFRERAGVEPRDASACSTPRGSDRAFDPARFLRNLGGVFERAREAPGRGGLSRGRPVSCARAARCATSTSAGADRLLLVASDRISAFDAVLPDTDPGQGPGADGLSLFWFERTRDLVAQPSGERGSRRRPGSTTISPGARCWCAAPTSCRSSASRAATCRARDGSSTARPARSAGWRSRRARASPTVCRSRSSPPPRRPPRATTCRSSPRRPPSWSGVASPSG